MAEKKINYKSGIIGFGDKLIFCASEGCPRVRECAAIAEYICESQERFDF